MGLLSLKRFVFLSFLVFACLSGCDNKRRNAEEALKRQHESIEAAKKEDETDTIKPEINFANEVIKYEVSDRVDREYLLNGVKAYDNVDGDITNLVTIKEDNIEEHKRGDYHITFSVEDKSGNLNELVVPVQITSRYSSDEEARYFSCIRAVNEITKRLKIPNSFKLRYLTVSESGDHVNILYTAENNIGGKISGGAYYLSNVNKLYMDDHIPMISIGYEYNWGELEKFDKYYNPDSYVNR